MYALFPPPCSRLLERAWSSTGYHARADVTEMRETVSGERDRLSAARRGVADDYVAKHKSRVLSLLKGVIDSGTISARPWHDSARPIRALSINGLPSIRS